jgi:SAM-dependent methyltransferase
MVNAQDRLTSVVASATGLRADERGLWSASAAVPSAFSQDSHDTCFQLESDSFWFQHRNRCIVELLRRHPPAGPMLDVGGGNGFVTQGLRAAGFDAIVLEPGVAGARNALQRGLAPVVNASLEAAAFPARSLSAIGLFDVIEHLDEAESFMSRAARLLQVGGRVYLTVPAYAWLWSSEDVAAGHHCRFTRASLCALLVRSGFAIEYASYFFACLVAPIFFVRVLPERLHLARPSGAAASDHSAGSSAVRNALSSVLRLEQRWIAQGRTLPVGASILVAARVEAQR